MSSRLISKLRNLIETSSSAGCTFIIQLLVSLGKTDFSIPRPPTDCCVKCYITAGEIQVFYWPVDTDTKRVTNASVPLVSTSKSLVSNGMTLLVHYQVSRLYRRTNATSSISPSVYVAYRDIRASDVCPSFGNGEFRRGGTYNTTIAYPPGILSTSICSEGNDFHQGFSTGNVTEQQHSTGYNSTCLGLDAIGDTTIGPYQSVSQDIIKLDPAWSSCTAALSGAVDSSIALQNEFRFGHVFKFPSIALHTAAALISEPSQNLPPTPAPASPVAPIHAPATQTPSPNKPGKPTLHSSTPEANIQGPEQQKPQPSDPIKPSTDNPENDSYNLSKQKPDPSDPIQPPTHDNNGDAGASADIPVSFKGGNVAQGDPEIVSDPKSIDPQSTGDISEGDSGADPENGHNAGSAFSPAGNLDQSPKDNAPSLPSIGGYQIQAANEGGIVIASTTLQPGIQTVIDSTPISVGKDQIVVASSTIPLAPPSVEPIITLINGDIISAGGIAAIVSGTTVALAPDSDALIVNGKSSPLPPPPTPILTVAGQTITAAPTGFAIGGQSVLPGGSAITYAGSVFSLATGGSALVVNGESSPLPPPSTPILTVAGQTITAAPTGFEVDGQSVLPGGPAITYAGSVFSLAPSGNALIVNGRTTPLPSVPISIFTLGSQTFTAAPTGFAIGGQSVLPGGSAVLMHGTLISLDLSSELVIGAETVPLGSAAQTGAGALAGLVSYGFEGGGGASPTGVASPTGASSNGPHLLPFAGGSGRLRVGVGMVVFALFVGLGVGGVAVEL